MTATTDLDRLTAKINAAHHACERAARKMIHHARQCGDALLRVKEAAGHGAFTTWIEGHCDFTPRHARRYITVAKGWAQLLALERNSKRTRESVLAIDSLTVREALRLLSAGGPEKDGWLWATSKPCPICGRYMVQTSPLWCTCEHCWDCRLHDHRVGAARSRQPPTVQEYLRSANRCVRELDIDSLNDLMTIAKQRLGKLGDPLAAQAARQDE